ncbi:hypothetical protein C7447_102255 [Tenacibaculum adriaticum]|uniref:Uncharacterized protein n=2 Tax=Tenacibaculum adriaticum TaxID=413713 RepID=A0A5S5DST5_9FLAO|nr:hypothetical protein C7447_102255 [Tenacibaculum adriaticum]
MPCKNEIDHEARREQISIWIDELLNDSENTIYSVYDAIKEIATTKLFCSVSNVYRAQKPYNPSQKVLFTPTENQLKFNI